MTEQNNQESIQAVKEKKMQDFLDLPLSRWAIDEIRAVRNRCFDNAWRLFCGYPNIFFRGTFIEGWIVFDLADEVVLNEHGWVEHPDGRMVDPSILLLVKPDQPVYYFPGIARTWFEMKRLVYEEREFPYVRFDGQHGPDGLGDRVYKAAHDAARSKVMLLAQRTRPHKKMTFLAAQDVGSDPRNQASQRRSILP